MRRFLGYSALAVLALAVILIARHKLTAGPPPIESRVRTSFAARGPVVAKITATGTLSALVTVQVGSQVSGRIAELKADFNSNVKKGQLIARIDPQLFLAAVEQARANLTAAEGNLAKAKAQSVDADRQADRQKALAKRELVAQADLDTAMANADAGRAAVQAAQGNVEQCKAGLFQARINLAYTEIVSPIDGVVISRNVDVGQTVAASLQAPTLFTIAEDLTRMQVDTNVAEADIGKLKPGMEATFTVDAFPQVPFKGRIRQIRNAPITLQNVVTYDAVIDVENPDLQLKPGMTANVTVVWAQVDDALRVPNAALRFRPTPDLTAERGSPATPAAGSERAHKPHGGTGGTKPSAAAPAKAPGFGGSRKQVWVVRSKRLELVPVLTGITDGAFTEITGGSLTENDSVAVEAMGEPSGGAAKGASPLGPPMGGPGGSGGMRRLF